MTIRRAPADVVQFTRESAERISRVVRESETAPLPGSALAFAPLAQAPQPRGMRLGKTTATWSAGTLATITLWEQGTPPNETQTSPTRTIANCVNKFGSVPANKWVALARGPGGRHYLIAAEC